MILGPVGLGCRDGIKQGDGLSGRPIAEGPRLPVRLGLGSGIRMLTSSSRSSRGASEGDPRGQCVAVTARSAGTRGRGGRQGRRRHVLPVIRAFRIRRRAGTRVRRPCSLLTPRVKRTRTLSDYKMRALHGSAGLADWHSSRDGNDGGSGRSAGPLAAWVVVVPTTRKCVRVKVRWWVGLGGAHRQKKGLLALLWRARLSRRPPLFLVCVCQQ